ncbi:hypothetical protein VCHA34P131_80056 [Vibrio chagasii]|nr:hypothetical protein VCHA34P131_80056 [Vibrio chagasii]CAH7063640.1 hypothetical protein VCHA34P121_70206 [Vibrio chagasii]CAH7250072.1 hypothetical protein VCHA39P226_390007 [Vibrio chagasii]CAH7255905.1 hypothetical protein VCHA52P456_300007 [Vibrio chagasii]CAH7321438.1 hypothetical protein VCHA52P453_430007 [Vibrio chagasii]
MHSCLGTIALGFTGRILRSYEFIHYSMVAHIVQLTVKASRYLQLVYLEYMHLFNVKVQIFPLEIFEIL